MFLISDYEHYFERFGDNFRDDEYIFDPKTYEQLSKLFDFIETHFEKQNDRFILYFKAEKGKFEEVYDDWEDCSEEELEYYKKEFEMEDESSILKLSFFKRDDDWLFVRYNDDKTIVVSTETENNAYKNITKLITEGLKPVVKEAYKLQKEGKYEEEIINKIKYKQRFGTLKLKDLMNIDEAYKENIYNGLSDEEIDDFIKLMNNPRPLMDKINVRIYLEACAAGYKANEAYSEQHARAKDIDDLKLKYRKVADGRDDGMLDLDLDSYEDFANWLAKGSRGGHPFEIATSMRISNSIHLYPEKTEDGKYYLVLSGTVSYRTSEIIRFALAIDKLGYPVEVYKWEYLIKRLNGETIVGITPEHIFSWGAEGYFYGMEDFDFSVGYYFLTEDRKEEEIDKINKLINWFPIEYSAIK